jgi:hypothetical protein
MSEHVEPAPVSRITGSTASIWQKIVASNTDRSYFRGCLFFASAPLIGLAMIVTNFVVDGHMDALFSAGFWVGLAFPLAPFLLIGMIAGVASLRGTMIGRCTWLGGLAPVLALEFIGLLEYRQGIHCGRPRCCTMTVASPRLFRVKKEIGVASGALSVPVPLLHARPGEQYDQSTAAELVQHQSALGAGLPRPTDQRIRANLTPFSSCPTEHRRSGSPPTI